MGKVIVSSPLLSCFRKLPYWCPLKMRIARMVLKRLMTTQDACIACDGWQCNVPSLREPIAFHLLIDGIYEPIVHQVIDRVLKPGGLFLDIGANVGAFAIPQAKKTGSAGKVLAVEASPTVYRFLVQNIQENALTNIQAINVALQEKEAAKIPFWEAPPEKFGMGALAPQFHPDKIELVGRRLDDLLLEFGYNKVNVMKVDVEGYEANVFEGALNLLEQNDSLIITFEFCDWAERRNSTHKIGDSQKLLKSMGYDLWSVTNWLKKGPPLRETLQDGTCQLVAMRPT